MDKKDLASHVSAHTHSHAQTWALGRWPTNVTEVSLMAACRVWAALLCARVDLGLMFRPGGLWLLTPLLTTFRIPILSTLTAGGGLPALIILSYKETQTISESLTQSPGSLIPRKHGPKQFLWWGGWGARHTTQPAGQTEVPSDKVPVRRAVGRATLTIGDLSFNLIDWRTPILHWQLETSFTIDYNLSSIKHKYIHLYKKINIFKSVLISKQTVTFSKRHLETICDFLHFH